MYRFAIFAGFLPGRPVPAASRPVPCAPSRPMRPAPLKERMARRRALPAARFPPRAARFRRVPRRPRGGTRPRPPLAARFRAPALVFFSVPGYNQDEF